MLALSVSPRFLNNYLVLCEPPEVFTDNSSGAERQPALGLERVLWPPGIAAQRSVLEHSCLWREMQHPAQPRAGREANPAEIPAALPQGIVYLGRLSPPRVSGCVDRLILQIWMLLPAECTFCWNKTPRGGVLLFEGCAVSSRSMFQPAQGLECVGQSPAWGRGCPPQACGNAAVAQGLGSQRGSLEAASPTGRAPQSPALPLLAWQSGNSPCRDEWRSSEPSAPQPCMLTWPGT